MNQKQDLSLNQQIEQVRRFGEAWPLGTVAAACTLIRVAAFYAFVLIEQAISAVQSSLKDLVSAQFRALKRVERTGTALAPAISEFRNPVLGSFVFRSSFEALPIP